MDVFNVGAPHGDYSLILRSGVYLTRRIRMTKRSYRQRWKTAHAAYGGEIRRGDVKSSMKIYSRLHKTLEGFAHENSYLYMLHQAHRKRPQGGTNETSECQAAH